MKQEKRNFPHYNERRQECNQVRGQESKVRDLKVDFSFHEKDFETVFTRKTVSRREQLKKG